MRRRGLLRAIGFLAGLAMVPALSGCHREDPGRATVCSPVGGAWNVVTEPINGGLVMTQSWTISIQGDCDVTITAGEPDLYGPLIGEDPVNGDAIEGGLWATWTKLSGACQIYSHLMATVEGSTFTGSIEMSRSGYGNGYCPPVYLVIDVTGSR